MASTAPNMLTNQDSSRENNSNVIVDDNVTIVADENVQSHSIRRNGIDLESQRSEPDKRSPDFDANHVPEI